MRSDLSHAAPRALALGVLAAACAGAAASPVTATYTGHVVDLREPAGALAGTLGPGTAVSARLNFDDSLPGVTLDSAPVGISASGELDFGGLVYTVTGLRISGRSVADAPGTPDYWTLLIQATGPDIAGTRFWGMQWTLDGPLRHFAGAPPAVPQQAGWCLPFGNGGCSILAANLDGDLQVEAARIPEAPTLPLVALAVGLMLTTGRRRGFVSAAAAPGP